MRRSTRRSTNCPAFVQRNDSAARIYGLSWEIAGPNDEARTFGGAPVGYIETDVVVAGFGGGRVFHTQRLLPFGPSLRPNQAKEERSYEEYMAR